RVSLRLATIPHAIVVPTQAVQTGQDGQYVFVVKGDSTVEQRPIVTAQRVDQDTVVQKGLQVGETVVTEGQLRLEPGVRVTTDTGGGGAAGGGRGRGGRGGNRGGGTGGGRAPQGPSNRLPSRESLRNLHPSTDRHQPADGGDRVVWRRRLPGAAGQRSAAGRLSDAERQRRPARRRPGHDGVGGREPAR